jgi:endonuclease/exonuclease/phosphatase family metal-dependent hydrolase
VLVLLFLSAFILLAFGRRISSRGIQVLAAIAILARVVEIFLSTRGRMIVGGIGVGAFLMYVPALLSQPRAGSNLKRFSREMGAGLALAVLASGMLRALNSGSDLSAFGMFRLLTLGLAAVALYLIFSVKAEATDQTQEEPASTKMGRVHAYTIGLMSAIIVLYFAFTAPNVVARWAGVSWISVFRVLMISWLFVGWLWLKKEKICPTQILAYGAAFALMLLFTILPQQVNFPRTQDVGYPLSAPQLAVWQYVPLYLMLVLSPILVMAFMANIEGIQREHPSLRQLAGAFGLAGLYLMIMVLAQVFTTVYDYIPVIGPFFRDKFWLVFLFPTIIAILPALMSPAATEENELAPTVSRNWLITAAAMTVIALVGLSALSAHPTTPTTSSSDTIRVYTYNIQQGYSDPGERNFDNQVAAIQSKTPDIVGLQECDTARIAGGNMDVVAYFADRLDMYSYYGPSPITGTFGVALLSKYPIENARTFFVYSKGEQVGVIEADITIDGKTYKVYVTHLGNSGPIFQIRQMLDRMRGQKNVIAMGDFNFRPYEDQYALATAEYDSAYDIAEGQVSPPVLDMNDRIDHVFVSQGIQVSYLEYTSKGVSDHPGLFVEIKK